MFFQTYKKVLLLIILVCNLNTYILANPKGANIISGDVSIKNESPTKLAIHQKTNKAIINWDSFNIGVKEHTQFYQPSSNSITLNRVISNDPSKILGQLSANGNIFLVNQNGIYFGKNSSVDVSGLIATTHDIKNTDFLNNNFNFSIAGKQTASIINEGKITAKEYGLIGLVSPYVHNRATIIAKLGKVELASGKAFTLDLYGDDLIKLHLEENYAQESYDLNGNKLNSFVENAGRIEAEGGYVALTSKTARDIVDSVVNQSGVIKATGFKEHNGKIILTGSSKGIVSNRGTLDTSNTSGKGGYIEITGEKIGLFSASKIDASGETGGGTILIGGDYLGGTASKETYESLDIQKEEKEIRTATFLNMSTDSIIKANAFNTGKGGKIVLWSDNTTRAYGTIVANGGMISGDGGFIEVSGKNSLDINNLNVSVNSINGNNGTILFDPNIVYIVSPNNPNIVNNSYDLTNFMESDETYISSSLIESYLNKGTNVNITAKGNRTYSNCTSYQGGGSCTGASGTYDNYIHIKDSIIKTSGGDTSLTFTARNDIYIDENVDIISYKNKLNLNFSFRTETAYPDNPYININTGTEIYTNGGTLSPNVMTKDEAKQNNIFHGTYYLRRLNLNGGKVSTEILFDGEPQLDNQNIIIQDSIKYQKLISEFEKDIQQYNNFKPFDNNTITGYIGNKLYFEDLGKNLYTSKEKRLEQLNQIDNLNQSLGSTNYQKALVSLGFVTDIANAYKTTTLDSDIANNIKNLEAVKKTADFINEKSQEFINMSKEEIVEYLNKNPDLKQTLLDFKTVIDEQSEESRKRLEKFEEKYPERYKNLVGTLALVNETSDLTPVKSITKKTIKNIDKNPLDNKLEITNKNYKGKQNREQRLKDLLKDDKVSSADKGWIQQEINAKNRGNKKYLRNPPGKDLAHERGKENAKGYGYEHSNLQDRDLHKTQHKFDNKGRKNQPR